MTNQGFARWAQKNKQELLRLEPGSHFGEWWGADIQRTYRLKEKRFSLFNVLRWELDRPARCGVVPLLWRGTIEDLQINNILGKLKTEGSVAAPGFMNPEGVVVFHVPSGTLFKKTLDKNDQAKG